MDNEPFEIAWVGDRAMRVAVGEGISEGTRARVEAAFERLSGAAIPGLVGVTPAYATLLLTFDLARLDPERAERAVRDALEGARTPEARAPRRVEIPVCYDAEFGIDLEDVARHAGLGVKEVAALHAGAEYVVHFLGFTPGFPYLGGLPERLSTPRLESPRRRVPAGSVAIGGAQAGVYPRETPGGWRVIGRTPFALFEPARDPPALLALGDRVRFVPIDRAEYARAAAGRP